MSDMNLGYNTLTETGVLHNDMLMDIGVYVFNPNETKEFIDPNQESAFLLLSGNVSITWPDGEAQASRSSLFDEKPACLHVPRNTAVTITANTVSEVLIQKTENDKQFTPVFYSPDNITDSILCPDLMQGTAKRILRDIFTYDNAPYSNMVMGEVITFPGKWSSYPPHHHPQPEVYFHRFDKPQGFGISLIGDEPSKVTHNSISTIPGGLCHPQVSAPGYAMYYCWMIRHLENNPWTARIDDPQHTWLYDKDSEIWGDKS